MSFELRPPEGVNLAGVETGRAHLSQTSIGTLLACEERFNLHYEQRLRTAVTKKPLAMGRAFAEALDIGDPDHAWHSLHAQARKERERAEGNPWVSLPTEQEVEVDAQIAREAARCYLARYGSHGEARELEMRARIRNPAKGGRFSLTHDLMARADSVNLDAGLLIEDKLSSSQMRPNLAQRVRIDRQVSIEAYLITDVQYRVTLKPAIRMRQGETHDAYLVRIAAEYATRPDHYLVDPPTVARDLDDFLRLERELWRWAETVREARRDGTWPRNTAACLDHGGCAYLPACSSEPGWESQFVTAPPREVVLA